MMGYILFHSSFREMKIEENDDDGEVEETDRESDQEEILGEEADEWMIMKREDEEQFDDEKEQLFVMLNLEEEYNEELGYYDPSYLVSF